jgi:dimeric dUTPase (all-alpha-NTP-PPase superfamily)
MEKPGDKLYTDKELKIVRTVLEHGYVWHGLSSLCKVQSIVSKKGINSTSNIQDLLNTYLNALHTEVAELSQELPVKPWKPLQVTNKANVIKEFSDILAFLGIIMVLLSELGISTAELADGYKSTTELNIARFSGKVEGYEND